MSGTQENKYRIKLTHVYTFQSMYVSAYTVPIYAVSTISGGTVFNTQGMSAQDGGQQEENEQKKHREARCVQGNGS